MFAALFTYTMYFSICYIADSYKPSHTLPKEPRRFIFQISYQPSFKVQTSGAVAQVALISTMFLFALEALAYDWHFHRRKRKLKIFQCNRPQDGLDLEAGTAGLRPLRLAAHIRESGIVQEDLSSSTVRGDHYVSVRDGREAGGFGRMLQVPPRVARMK